MKQRQVHEDEWFDIQVGDSLTCCDCGLAHDIDVRITADNKVYLKVKRNNHRTAAKRRNNDFVCTPRSPMTKRPEFAPPSTVPGKPVRAITPSGRPKGKVEKPASKPFPKTRQTPGRSI